MVSYSGRIQPQEEGDKERGSITMEDMEKKERRKEPCGLGRYKTMSRDEKLRTPFGQLWNHARFRFQQIWNSCTNSVTDTLICFR